MVDDSPGYLADHWCNEGRIPFCLKGKLETTLDDGRKCALTPRMSYQIGDSAEAYPSYTRTGAKLFVID